MPGDLLPGACATDMLVGPNLPSGLLPASLGRPAATPAPLPKPPRWSWRWWSSTPGTVWRTA
eukprot:11209602-Lingulodinium_polyedra.AAC.1